MVENEVSVELKTAISPPSSKAVLCGVALFMPQRVLRLRGAFCGCDDLIVFEQLDFFNSHLR